MSSVSGALLCPSRGARESADPDAVLVTEAGHRIGYVPAPLLDYVRPAMAHHHDLTVEQVNDLDAGFHVRLLVRLAGHLPA